MLPLDESPPSPQAEVPTMDQPSEGAAGSATSQVLVGNSPLSLNPPIQCQTQPVQGKPTVSSNLSAKTDLSMVSILFRMNGNMAQFSVYLALPQFRHKAYRSRCKALFNKPYNWSANFATKLATNWRPIPAVPFSAKTRRKGQAMARQMQLPVATSNRNSSRTRSSVAKCAATRQMDSTSVHSGGKHDVLFLLTTLNPSFILQLCSLFRLLSTLNLGSMLFLLQFLFDSLPPIASSSINATFASARSATLPVSLVC